MTIVNIKEARSTIRKILQGGKGRIQPSPHCRQRMLERQVFMEDIFHVLFWGEVIAGQHPGDAEKNIFRVAGLDIEEVPLTLVIRIVVAQKFIEIISVFGEMHGQA
ncbi:MAG: DUF4258 domain-containing protein [Deltaproteobacteria bacterium]|nr:DUF4258 domain-containing protein [Deltaproteobacteria bacterium]MBI4796929.1 DUF4258 domain-containing protein [Deltaproteobacteria bacterium]